MQDNPIRPERRQFTLDKLERLVEASGLQVTAAVPLLASFLSIPDDGRYPLEPMSPQQRKERTP
jgi:hypothetical protein